MGLASENWYHLIYGPTVTLHEKPDVGMGEASDSVRFSVHPNLSVEIRGFLFDYPSSKHVKGEYGGKKAMRVIELGQNAAILLSSLRSFLIKNSSLLPSSRCLNLIMASVPAPKATWFPPPLESNAV